MSSPVRQFKNRSFRYVLRTADNADMRFSLQSTQGAAGIEKTQLIDLSETGMSFLLGPATDVVVNERIKVEIPIPGGEQIAWWARVVRIEQHEPRGWSFASDGFGDDPPIKVAVRFEALPEAHARAIRQGLERSFMRAMRDQQYRNWLYYRTIALQNAWKAAVITALSVFVIGFIYYFSLPSANYDAEKGAPWGERFKFFDKK